jgi:hypothetical protein
MFYFGAGIQALLESATLFLPLENVFERWGEIFELSCRSLCRVTAQ